MGPEWDAEEEWAADERPGLPAVPFLELRGFSAAMEGAAAVGAAGGLDLDIREQELFCIVGPRRCGKTALARAMAGLATPTAGMVRLSGRGVPLEGEQVGFVASEDSLFPWLTARQNVGLPLRLGRRPADPWRCEALLAMAGLLEHGRLYPGEMSPAMRLLVEVCRALVREPAVVVIDEPFGGLDPAEIRVLAEALMRMRANSRCPFVVFTADAAAAVHAADRIAVLAGAPTRLAGVVDARPPRAPRAEAAVLADVVALAGPA